MWVALILDLEHGAKHPRVAYNTIDNQYLAVWQGTDGDDQNSAEWEIYGQRLDDRALQIGLDDFQISTMGIPGNPDYDAWKPAVTFNHRNRRYLVVWYGDDQRSGLADEEWEIFGQYLTWGGSQIAPFDFRISDLGPNGDLNYQAFNPAASYNPTQNEFLVVFMGDDDQGGLSNDEFYLFGQRVHGAPQVFSDGFETGDTRAWDDSIP